MGNNLTLNLVDTTGEYLLLTEQGDYMFNRITYLRFEDKSQFVRSKANSSVKCTDCGKMFIIMISIDYRDVCRV